MGFSMALAAVALFTKTVADPKETSRTPVLFICLTAVRGLCIVLSDRSNSSCKPFSSRCWYAQPVFPRVHLHDDLDLSNKRR
jgi:hypothetical protein